MFVSVLIGLFILFLILLRFYFFISHDFSNLSFSDQSSSILIASSNSYSLQF